MSRNIIVAVAATNEPKCLEYYAPFVLDDELVSEVARELALIFLGYQPFVFASFPISTSPATIRSKMEELWKKYKSHPGKN